MSIVKKVEIDGKRVSFKASAAIPRIYRLKFQRDIYKDLSVLEKSINQANPDDSNLDLLSGVTTAHGALGTECQN